MCIIQMQRKYSEVANLNIPNFQTFQQRRHYRQATYSQRLSPVQPSRPNMSSTTITSPQNQQFYAPPQLQAGVSSYRNASFQVNERRSLPTFGVKIEPTQGNGMLSTDPRTQIVTRNNMLMENTNVNRRVINQNLSMEPIQYMNSPQNIGRVFQMEMGPVSQNARRNVITAHTSPNKTQPYHSQPSLNQISSPLLPNRVLDYRNFSYTQSARQSGRACQSVIFPQVSLDNRSNQQNTSNSATNARNNSNSDLQSTFSSENNYSNQFQMNSPIFSDPGSFGKKTELTMGMKRNQDMWKSSIDISLARNANMESISKLDQAELVNSPKLSIERQENFAKQKRRQQPQPKIETTQKQGFVQRYLPELKKDQGEDIFNKVQLKFKKKQTSQSNNIVDINKNAREYIPALEPPRAFTIDDFEVKQKLGKGTYGDVFLVREKRSKFVCVLKTLSKKKIKEKNLEELVFRQIKIQSYLVHRHITSLYGVFDDRDKIYLIMECMPDGSMSSNGKKKISQNETAHLIYQVLQGLQYMHRQDIIHRDIKPQNLLLNNTYLKIGDFGCAVFGNTLRSTVVGCYAYISPQQFSNNPYDEKIDSWSVGILAYQLLTGRPPYEEKLRQIACQNQLKNQQSESLKVEFSNLTFPGDIKMSGEAIDFIKRLLDPDPITRAGVKQAIKHRFLLKAKQYQKYLQSQL